MTSNSGWPEPFDPATAPVFAHNEIHSTLPAEILWPRLIRVTDWPRWYRHAADVRTADGTPDVRLGSVFSWKTLGVRVTTTVTEFAPGRELAWSGTAPGAKGYHRWVFARTEDGGCRIVTEEVQTGLVPRLRARGLRRRLRENHQEWLEALVITPGGADRDATSS